MKPKFNEVKPIDKFRDCVKMKLHGKVLPINKIYYFSREVPDVELQLTFNFGEHSFIESKTQTKIEFGITQGKLFLECNNVTMPEESRGFLRPFLIETKMIQSQEENITTKNSWSINLKQTIRLQTIFDFLFKWGREETKSKKDGLNYEDIKYQAFSQGSEKEPVIYFQLKQCNSPILVGGRQKERVGIVKVDNVRHWSIKAYFKINIKNIVVTKYEDKSIDELNPFEKRKFKLASKNFINEMNKQVGDWICYSEITSK